MPVDGGRVVSGGQEIGGSRQQGCPLHPRSPPRLGYRSPATNLPTWFNGTEVCRVRHMTERGHQFSIDCKNPSLPAQSRMGDEAPDGPALAGGHRGATSAVVLPDDTDICRGTGAAKFEPDGEDAAFADAR